MQTGYRKQVSLQNLLKEAHRANKIQNNDIIQCIESVYKDITEEAICVVYAVFFKRQYEEYGLEVLKSSKYVTSNYRQDLAPLIWYMRNALNWEIRRSKFSKNMSDALSINHITDIDDDDLPELSIDGLAADIVKSHAMDMVKALGDTHYRVFSLLEREELSVSQVVEETGLTRYAVNKIKKDVDRFNKDWTDERL